MQSKFGEWYFLMSFTVIALLCTADVATTVYTISNSIGYESNALIAGLVKSPLFYYIKYFTTISIVILISAMCGERYRRLEVISFVTLASFYAIVVVNNLLVIFASSDLDLSIEKLFVIFFAMFVTLMKAVPDNR